MQRNNVQFLHRRDCHILFLYISTLILWDNSHQNCNLHGYQLWKTTNLNFNPEGDLLSTSRSPSIKHKVAFIPRGPWTGSRGRDKFLQGPCHHRVAFPRGDGRCGSVWDCRKGWGGGGGKGEDRTFLHPDQAWREDRRTGFNCVVCVCLFLATLRI